jgi:hypothetical protein
MSNHVQKLKRGQRVYCKDDKDKNDCIIIAIPAVIGKSLHIVLHDYVFIRTKIKRKDFVCIEKIENLELTLPPEKSRRRRIVRKK